ncbi:MAG: hypothetical protein JST82_11300 [Bacteroidetes bacterium]|nr:hypothetical protein [Bacteroidota bacterium]
MQKSEKVIVSATTLFTSLLSYWYAREAQRDATPYVMIGGFLGSLLGEIISDNINHSDKTKN